MSKRHPRAPACVHCRSSVTASPRRDDDVLRGRLLGDVISRCMVVHASLRNWTGNLAEIDVNSIAAELEKLWGF